MSEASSVRERRGQQQQTWVKGTVDTTVKRTHITGSTSQDTVWLPGFLAETIIAYLFWTVFIDLIPNMWFIPMDAMSVTDGEEFSYLIAYTFPLLLKITFIREFVGNHPTIFNILSLVGLLSPFASKLREKNLLGFFGTGLGIMAHFSTFWRGEHQAERASYAHLLALVAFVSGRFAFSTMIPLWMDPLYTMIAIGVGILASVVIGFDPDFVLHKDAFQRNASFSTDLRYGTGLGVLMFLSHWILTSHSLLPRWIDVDTFIGGIAIIASMVLGVLLSSIQPFVRTWPWWMAGTLSGAFILSPFFTPYQALGLCCVVVTYLTSVWYVSLLDISRHANMTRSLLIGFVLYVFCQLAVIWSIAWCFVPEGTGGPFMRERAYQMFVLLLVLMGVAYNTYSYRSDRVHRSFPRKEVLIVLAIILVCVTAPAIAKRAQNWHNYSAYEGIEKTNVRAMAWAIRFGYDNHGFQNFREVAQKIRDVGASVIGLVETDMQRPFNRNQDLVEYLEEELHLYSDYGPSTMNETWGCALLSAYPIVRSDREVLPSPEGENACLIDATLNVDGKLLDVIVVHVGNTQHVLDRELQAIDMANRVKAKKAAARKTLWLGYLTDKPHGPNYKRITDAGLVDTAPTEARYCIYLFHMGMTVSKYERIDVLHVSDTEIQKADFSF